MTSTRIQKLLLSEYKDFHDVVILESPFAQTNRDGVGIRQVQIGLTPTKLIVAKDSLEWEDPAIRTDPEISTLELVSIMPVECVGLSPYRRRTRKTIKAHFVNQQTLYFELSGQFRRDLWKERDIFLGSCFGLPVEQKEQKKLQGNPYTPRVKDTIDDGNVPVQLVNRFGAGIGENCLTGLYLPAEVYLDYPVSESARSTTTKSYELSGRKFDFETLADQSVALWEASAASNVRKHKRRNGIMPFGNVLSGIGPLNISKNQALSIQMKRSSSEVNLRENQLSLDLPKRLLVSSSSSLNLFEPETAHEFVEDRPIRSSLSYYHFPKKANLVKFWTPDYSYRPESAKIAHRKLKRLMKKIHDYLRSLECKKRTKFWHKNSQKQTRENSESDISRVESHITLLKIELKMDIDSSAWDFDSSIMSYSITVIERQLFLNITTEEMLTIIIERKSDNAPNVRAAIAFSERLANLIASEIVRIDSVKMRARLIGRFINLADKLHRLHNMQSTQSVLLGLQKPSVYRLADTWNYVRLNHSSKYQRLSFLLKLYREARNVAFYRLFDRYSRTPPYLPSLHFLIAGLLGRLPKPVRRGSHNSTADIVGYQRRSLQEHASRDSSNFIAHLETYLRPLPLDDYSPALRLDATRVSLKVWQSAAKKYELVDSLVVREFLLKGQYMTELECFSFSKCLTTNPSKK